MTPIPVFSLLPTHLPHHLLGICTPCHDVMPCFSFFVLFLVVVSTITVRISYYAEHAVKEHRYDSEGTLQSTSAEKDCNDA